MNSKLLLTDVLRTFLVSVGAMLATSDLAFALFKEPVETKIHIYISSIAVTAALILYKRYKGGYNSNS